LFECMYESMCYYHCLGDNQNMNKSRPNCRESNFSNSEDSAKKNKRPQGDCDAVFSEWAVRNNFSVLEYSRTCQAAASGVAAGILGLTGLAGFVFYFLCALAQSCVWYWKTDCRWKDYFPNFSTILLHGLFGGLFTYVLFWTFLYGIVHVY
ncbi:ER membrane protein complex subunit 6, partial [Trichinella papuae]